jgi:hypothetical protein
MVKPFDRMAQPVNLNLRTLVAHRICEENPLLARSWLALLTNHFSLITYMSRRN